MYVLLWTACGGGNADTTVSGAHEHAAVLAAPTRERLEAALCSIHPERAHDLPCVVDQLSSVGATPDARPIYVARVLPYGACEGHTYCVTTEPVETPAVAGFAAVGGTFGDDAFFARELGLEEECVPMHFDRVIVNSDGSLATRPLARVCTQMSAGGSSETFSVAGQEITLSSSFSSSWIDTLVSRAGVFPFRVIEVGEYGTSRRGMGSLSHHFNYVSNIGSGSAVPDVEEGAQEIQSSYVMIPNLLAQAAIGEDTPLGTCSTPLRTEPQFANLDTPSADANAPRLLFHDADVYIEMPVAHPFEILFTSQQAANDEVFAGHSLRYTVDAAGSFVAPEDELVGYRSTVATTRLSNGHVLARVEFPFLNRQLGNPALRFLNQPAFVRVGNYRSFTTSSPDGVPQMSSSMSVNVQCSVLGGVLTLSPNPPMENCTDCMLHRD